MVLAAHQLQIRISLWTRPSLAGSARHMDIVMILVNHSHNLCNVNHRDTQFTGSID